MDALELGAYFSLILACYQAKDHRLPVDHKRLMYMARCTKRNWGKVCGTILEKFTIDPENDQKLMHERINFETEKILLTSSENQAKALKRWSSTNATAKPEQSRGNAIQYPISKIQYPSDIVSLKRERDYGGRYDIRRHLTESEIDGCRLLAAGRSLDSLFDLYNGMVADGKFNEPKRPEMAFPAWIKNYTGLTKKGEKL